MTIQNKEKSIFETKNTNESIQVGLRVVEKEKEKNFLKVRISLQCQIIHNTCKIRFLKLIIALYNL